MQTPRDEFEYLLHLIRCAIHGIQPEELPEGLDFGRVYECGAYHHVANIAFYSLQKLKNKPEPALYARWEECCNQAIVLDFNQSFAAQEIRDALQKAGIRFLEVQGTKLKPLYPQPEWRTMSDIDFIIDPENLMAGKEILERLGYTCQVAHEVEISGFRPPNINIELHTDYFFEFNDYYGMMRPPYAAVDENGKYPIDEFYLYNILHIAKHYFWGGCGVRRVLDAYYLNREYGACINSDYVNSYFEKAQIVPFARELAQLADFWFSPEAQHFPNSEMAAYIRGSGLHGTWRNDMSNRLRKMENSGSWGFKVKYLLGRLWGGKEVLYTNYPILERFPVLYPFCWLHRVFRSLSPVTMKRLRKETEIVMNTKETK